MRLVSFIWMQERFLQFLCLSVQFEVWSSKNAVKALAGSCTVFVHIPLVSSGLYDFFDDATNKLSLLSMPLAHKKSTVVFIMPHRLEPLERLEKILTKVQLDMWMKRLKQTAVAVSLPKVSMEVSHNLQVNYAEVPEASSFSTPTQNPFSLSPFYLYVHL